MICFNFSSFSQNPTIAVDKINTMGATSGAGTAYPFRAPKFTPSF